MRHDDTKTRFKAGDGASLRAYYDSDPTDLYFKVLSHRGRPKIAGRGKWNLPKPLGLGCYTVGRAQPHVHDPRACRRGWHISKGHDITFWFSHGDLLFIVEPRGKVVNDYHKSACQSARLIVPVPMSHVVLKRGMFASIRTGVLVILGMSDVGQRKEAWRKFIDRHEAKGIPNYPGGE